MTRMPLVDPDQATGEVGDALRAPAARLNIFRTLAHAETTALPQMRLGRAILGKQCLSHVARELLILLVARLEGGEYEWVQHVPIALGVGVTQAQIDAIAALQLDAAVFDPAQTALLAFGRQVVETARADDAVFAAAKAHFPDREIVEAILAIGFYMTMARLTETCQTPIDAAAGMTVFNAVQARGKPAAGR